MKKTFYTILALKVEECPGNGDFCATADPLKETSGFNGARLLQFCGKL